MTTEETLKKEFEEISKEFPKGIWSRREGVDYTEWKLVQAELQAREECQKESEEKDKIMDNLKDLIFSHTRTKIQLEDIIAKQKKEFQDKIEKFIKIFDKNDKDTIWSSAVVYFEFKQIFGEQQ
jgi:hypothetical protein